MLSCLLAIDIEAYVFEQACNDLHVLNCMSVCFSVCESMDIIYTACHYQQDAQIVTLSTLPDPGVRL